MKPFFLIFMGGGLGSFCRFYIASWAIDQLGPSFPFGTLIVNLLGSLIIGLIAGLPQASASLAPNTRLFLMTGILGGFTTFSSYEYESFMLTTDGEFGKAALNLILSMCLGFFMVGLGFIGMRYLTGLLRGGT